MSAKYKEEEIRTRKAQEIPDYQECKICGKLFAVEHLVLIGQLTEMEMHYKLDHNMVKVWKGRNSRWVPLAEIVAKIEKDGTGH
jgi:hypothetical protein